LKTASLLFLLLTSNRVFTHYKKEIQLLPKRTATTGRKPRDPRQMLNGILWILRTAAPWRDLPERFGPWQSVYDYYRNWQNNSTFDKQPVKIWNDKSQIQSDNSNSPHYNLLSEYVCHSCFCQDPAALPNIPVKSAGFFICKR